VPFGRTIFLPLSLFQIIKLAVLINLKSGFISVLAVHLTADGETLILLPVDVHGGQ
jgi:hypothetical protein